MRVRVRKDETIERCFYGCRGYGMAQQQAATRPWDAELPEELLKRRALIQKIDAVRIGTSRTAWQGFTRMCVEEGLVPQVVCGDLMRTYPGLMAGLQTNGHLYMRTRGGRPPCGAWIIVAWLRLLKDLRVGGETE